jgi:hypothetical protein
MKTNSFFSFPRFCRFLSYDLRIHGKRYLYFLAGGAVILYLMLLLGITIAGTTELGTDFYFNMFLWGLLGLGLFIGSAFPELNNKIKAGNYVLLPASVFEKTLSQFLVYIVFGSLCFLLIFQVDAYLAKWTVWQMKGLLQSGTSLADFQYSKIFPAWLGLSFWNKLWVGISVVSAGLIIFTVRLFFARFALAKSLIVILLIGFAHTCYLVLFSHIFYPETTGFEVKVPLYILDSGLHNYEFYYNILFCSLWVFLLPLACYKLKERQV